MVWVDNHQAAESLARLDGSPHLPHVLNGTTPETVAEEVAH
jgi:hypothetical protein